MLPIQTYFLCRLEGRPIEATLITKNPNDDRGDIYVNLIDRYGSYHQIHHIGGSKFEAIGGLSISLEGVKRSGETYFPIHGITNKVTDYGEFTESGRFISLDLELRLCGPGSKHMKPLPQTYSPTQSFLLVTAYVLGALICYILIRKITMYYYKKYNKKKN